jgi:hypothetical protein
MVSSPLTIPLIDVYSLRPQNPDEGQDPNASEVDEEVVEETLSEGFDDNPFFEVPMRWDH